MSRLARECCQFPPASRAYCVTFRFQPKRDLQTTGSAQPTMSASGILSRPELDFTLEFRFQLKKAAVATSVIARELEACVLWTRGMHTRRCIARTADLFFSRSRQKPPCHCRQSPEQDRQSCRRKQQCCRAEIVHFNDKSWWPVLMLCSMPGCMAKTHIVSGRHSNFLIDDAAR